MRFPKGHSLKEIAELLSIEFRGNPDLNLTGLNEIHVVEEGDIVFSDHPKYYQKAIDSNASCVLLDQEVEFPEGKGILLTSQPFDDFIRLIRHFKNFHHDIGHIGEDTKVHSSAIIYGGVHLGNNVHIDEGVVLHPNVVIYDDVIIGKDTIVHANTVIGSHAFYYQKKEGKYQQFPSCGRVVIGSGVEIGASCTIDKGVTSDTKIGDGTKLDNQVHVGHDTVIGKNCLVAAQVGIAGCVVMEDEVTLWGQVGLASGITMGKGSVMYAQAGTSKSVEAGKVYFGSPAGEFREKFRELNAIKALPEALRKLAQKD